MAAFISYNNLLKAFGTHRPKIVYEIDDAITMLPEDNPTFNTFNKARPQINEYLIEADLVTVSTSKLKSLYSSHNNNIAVLPNCLDMRIWSGSVERENADDTVRILFSGTKTHANDLRLIEKAIITIISEFGEKVRLLFWGDTSKRLSKYPQIQNLNEYLTDYAEYADRLKNINLENDFFAAIYNNLFINGY